MDFGIGDLGGIIDNAGVLGRLLTRWLYGGILIGGLLVDLYAVCIHIEASVADTAQQGKRQDHIGDLGGCSAGFFLFVLTHSHYTP